MRGYLLIDLNRERSRVVKTLEEAAQIVGAEAADIDWWLEEAGIWEGDCWAVANVVTDLNSTRCQSNPSARNAQ